MPMMKLDLSNTVIDLLDEVRGQMPREEFIQSILESVTRDLRCAKIPEKELCKWV